VPTGKSQTTYKEDARLMSTEVDTTTTPTPSFEDVTVSSQSTFTFLDGKLT